MRVTMLALVLYPVLFIGPQLDAQVKVNYAVKKLVLDEARAAKLGAKSSNALGWSLYRVLAKQPGNKVFSPYSLTMGLAMLSRGARNGTARQIDQATQSHAYYLSSTMAGL